MYKFRVEMHQLVNSLNSLNVELHEYICSTRVVLLQYFRASRDLLLQDVHAARSQLYEDYRDITARLDFVDSMGCKVHKVNIPNSSENWNEL